MTLIQSWIESLTLLKPKNAYLFALVTLKSIIETYKVMALYWSWAIVILIGCYLMSPHVYGIDSNEAIISRWFYELLVFATCLTTRPSVEQKKCAYFRAHISAFIYIMIYLAIAPFNWWPTGFSPWAIFWILFFIDSERGFKNFFLSLWYALKMIVFNAPLILIMVIIFSIPLWCFKTVFFINPLLQNVLGALVLPIGVCTYANIYIKKLHDQFDLYFKPVQ